MKTIAVVLLLISAAYHVYKIIEIIKNVGEK
jgi:sirohydrochlorin ferrochelatase